MILEDIEIKLNEIGENFTVCYGMIDPRINEMTWQYIVFNRTTLTPSTNKTGYTEGYSVNIICENYIPEGLAEKIINKMCEIAGVKIASGAMQYNYLMKPNTNIVVELLTIDFIRAKKA